MVKCGSNCMLSPVLKWGLLDLTPGKLVELVSRRSIISHAGSLPAAPICCVAFARKHSGLAHSIARRDATTTLVTEPQQNFYNSSSALGQQLSEEQRAAVETPDDCVRVVAGPGSGKTLVLTHRIAHLIAERGINPARILCLTFTNKAKDELRQRLTKLLGKDALKLTIGTFHSVCVRILRENATKDEDGIDGDFVIYDDQDSEKVVKKILCDLAACGESTKVDLSGQIRKLSIEAGDHESATREQKQKPAASSHLVQTTLKGIADVKEFELKRFVAKQTLRSEFLDMPQTLKPYWPEFCRYQATLRAANAADFDDLIFQTVRILYRRTDLRQGYERRWSYVLADEFQDTDWAQYVFLRLLCGINEKLFVVGDVDQAIYGWRGADYKHMQDLEIHFRGVSTFELRRNYRSSQNILELAAEVIKRSNRQSKLKPLKLEAVRPRGPPVTYTQCLDSNSEASYVVKAIRKLVDKKDTTSYRSCGVLFRTRAQGQVFETWCLAHKIPYTVGGSIALLSRKEVKNLRAYLQLIWNPDDALALAQVINTPPRGLGQTTLKKINDWASNLSISFPQALRKLFSEETGHKMLGITSRARKSLSQFCQLQEDLVRQSEHEPVSVLIQKILNRTGMFEYYKRMDGADNSERVHHLHLFQELAKSMEAEHDCGRPALRGFLESIALNADQQEGIAEPADAVRLSTLHAAKGLEFDYVFIAGVEEGNLPLGNSDVEEERRLFYVGITRARKELYITSRLRVFAPGEGFKDSRVSHFLTSISNVHKDQNVVIHYPGDSA